MEDMVRDMRNRFLVALVLSVPILLWSPIGREVIGFEAPAPFGLRDDVFSLILSIALMGVAASFIARLLQKHRWIAYVGLAIILYVAAEMIWRGSLEIMSVAGM